MAWRGIHLSKPAYLSVEHRALRLKFREDDQPDFRQPLEDLAYLIIDTTEVTLSARLLSSLSAAGTLVVGVDQKHLPNWTVLPWTQFYRQGDIIELQIATSGPLKKRIWANIVRTKILHQSLVLDRFDKSGGSTLRAMINHIRSGDADNTEARAARYYWKNLFNDREFRRHDEDLPNALLNYGYALIRAAISRTLCGAGFIPQLGLHHCSVSNSYNLADDLIEPYRPFVDALTLEVLADSGLPVDFSTEHRRAMVRLLELQVNLAEESYGILTAIELTVTSLRTSLTKKDCDSLIFPNLLTT